MWWELLSNFFLTLATALGLIKSEKDMTAGAAIEQNEANNEEHIRIGNSAAAGAAVERLPIDTPDPYDLDASK